LASPCVRALTSYIAEEAQLIAQHASKEIENLLIDLYVIHDMYRYHNRHSRAGA
jgi:hypothetical protein